MKTHFTVEEFCIEGGTVPQVVATKLMNHHIIPMSVVREVYGKPIYVSKHSGYRSRKWELSTDRDGESQHCFGERENGTFDPKALGAGDYTSDNVKELIQFIIDHTSYTRICFYPGKGFVHCDYKPIKGGRRAYYESNDSNEWSFKRFLN